MMPTDKTKEEKEDQNKKRPKRRKIEEMRRVVKPGNESQRVAGLMKDRHGQVMKEYGITVDAVIGKVMNMGVKSDFVSPVFFD